MFSVPDYRFIEPVMRFVEETLAQKRAVAEHCLEECAASGLGREISRKRLKRPVINRRACPEPARDAALDPRRITCFGKPPKTGQER